MPTQYPTLSGAEATERWNNMAKLNLYPYTYIFEGSFLTTEFPRTSGGVSYLTLAFQANNNLAISDLEVSFSGVPQLISASNQDTQGQIFYQISYDSNLNANALNTLPAVPVPIVPTDSGNIIYDSITQFKSAAHAGAIAGTLYADPVTINTFNRFEPYNYLVKFNQIVYIHVGMSFNGFSGTGPDGTWLSSVIFHCLDTGLKT